jgi:preprotein translocase subunit SecG
MQSLALVIHVVLAVGVIGLVLMQHGKGADAGAAFGSGASATVFGARGSASFLTKATTLLATLFFLTSLFLFYLAAHRDGSVRSVTDVPGIVEDAPPAAPADLPGAVSDDSADSDAPSPPSNSQSDSDLPTPAE